MEQWKGIKLSGSLQNSTNLRLTKRTTILIALALVTFGILSRFLPHPPNFAPIAAIGLFAGVILPRKMAILLPLAAMVVSDVFLGFHGLIFWTWGAFLLIGLFSTYVLKKKYSMTTVLASSIGASIFFYLVTNFGVWAEGLLYPPTLGGLVSSYVNALPFLRNTLMGNMFYSAALFGAYEFAVLSAPKLKAKLSYA